MASSDPSVNLTPSRRLAVTLPYDLVDRLERIAVSRGIGLSTLVRMLLYASTSEAEQVDG